MHCVPEAAKKGTLTGATGEGREAKPPSPPKPKALLGPLGAPRVPPPSGGGGAAATEPATLSRRCRVTSVCDCGGQHGPEQASMCK